LNYRFAFYRGELAKVAQEAPSKAYIFGKCQRLPRISPLDVKISPLDVKISPLDVKYPLGEPHKHWVFKSLTVKGLKY
jgi:hypothetical protein